MKIKFLSSYKNANGTLVFVYKVMGSKAQLTAYAESQGDYLKFEDNDETKAPLFFETRYGGNTGTLTISEKTGKAYIDRSEENKIISLMEQYKGTAYGDALANQYAAKQMAELSKSTTTSVAEKSTPAPSAEKVEGSELDAL